MPTHIAPPSEAISPELTDDRLSAIARAIASGRASKLALRQPQDVTWNLSCDCYIWAWSALRDASEGELREWLHVPGKHGDLNNYFRIGGPDGIPARFYRADSPGQPLRTSRPVADEPHISIQSELPLDDRRAAPPPESDALSSVVRFAVAVAADLTATSVEVQKIDAEGNIEYAWPILINDVDVLSLGEAGREEAVHLAEIEVELADDKAAREELKRLEQEKADAEKAAEKKKKGA